MLRVLIEDRHFSITRGCKEYMASFVESKHEEDWQEMGNPKWRHCQSWLVSLVI